MIAYIAISTGGFKITKKGVSRSSGASCGPLINFSDNFFFFVYHGRDLDDRLYYVLFPRGYRWEKYTPNFNGAL